MLLVQVFGCSPMPCHFGSESLNFRFQGIGGSSHGFSECMPHRLRSQVNIAVNVFVAPMNSPECFEFPLFGYFLLFLFAIGRTVREPAS